MFFFLSLANMLGTVGDAEPGKDKSCSYIIVCVGGEAG